MGCTSSRWSSQLFSTSFDSQADPSSSALSIQTNPTDSLLDTPIYEFHEFTDVTYLSSGCLGTVYSANHRRLGKVALKFFGYTNQYPDLVSIHHELAFLSSLRGVDGAVQLKGYTYDQEEGYIEGKKYSGEFPILVMELLNGVELPKSVQNQRTEKYISQIFRCLILALQGIHEHRFIHRDLKLENLMLVSNSKDPKLKIIDFGSMVNLPPVLSTGKSKRSLDSNASSDIYRGCSIVGSPGMIAPETVMNYEYSFATDIWQTGCVLYSLLSGQHAFSPNRIDKIVNAAYFPMSSPQWDTISPEAKNLVSLILVKNPSDRLTIPQILCHTWLTNHQVSQRDFGDEYSARIKSLTLSRRIREAFMKQDNLIQTRREKLESIQRLTPSLNIDQLNRDRRFSLQSVREENDRESCVSENISAVSPNSNITIQQTIEERVFVLKKNIIDYLQNSYLLKSRTLNLEGIIYEEENYPSEAPSPQKQTFPTTPTSQPRNGSISSDTDDGSGLVSSLSGLTQPSHHSIMSEISTSPTVTMINEKSMSGILSASLSHPLLSPRNKYPPKTRYIDYPTYVNILSVSGLDTFATQEIFDLFDTTNSSKIDILDVLFTFLLMYEDLADYYSSTPIQQLTGDVPSPFDNSKLYFDMFDLNHTGVIDAKSLKVILRCLLLEEKYLSHSHSTILKPSSSNQQLLPTKNSMKSKSHSHIRHRSSSSEASPVVRMLSQQSGTFQQSYETIKTLRSGEYDELFQILDEEKNGYVTYDQFKDFYDSLYLQLDSLPPSMI